MSKRRFQFRIASLLILTLGFAIVLAATRPFDPNLRFSDPEFATYIGVDDAKHACAHVTVSNNGLMPIWVPGHSGLVLSFSYQGNPSDDPLENLENLNWTSQTPVTHTALYHGESAVVRIPKHADYETAKVGLQALDWRGRTADCWSEEFPFPAAPDGG